MVAQHMELVDLAVVVDSAGSVVVAVVVSDAWVTGTR